MVAPVVQAIRWGFQLADELSRSPTAYDDELYVLFDQLMDVDRSARSSDFVLTVDGTNKSWEETSGIWLANDSIYLTDNAFTRASFGTVAERLAALNAAFGLSLSAGAVRSRVMELHFSGAISSQPTGRGVTQLSYRSPGQRFGMRNEDGTDYLADFSHPIPYTRAAPQPQPMPQPTPAIAQVLKTNRGKFNMHLQNFDRDMSWLTLNKYGQWPNSAAISASPAVRTDGVVYDGEASISWLGAANLALTSGHVRAAGLHMRGVDDSDARVLYRVKGMLACSPAKHTLMFCVGVNPNTPASGAAGNAASYQFCIAAGGVGETLIVDDVLCIPSYGGLSGVDSGDPLMFYGVVYAAASENVRVSGYLSVQRLVGVPPQYISSLR